MSLELNAQIGYWYCFAYMQQITPSWTLFRLKSHSLFCPKQTSPTALTRKGATLVEILQKTTVKLSSYGTLVTDIFETESIMSANWQRKWFSRKTIIQHNKTRVKKLYWKYKTTRCVTQYARMSRYMATPKLLFLANMHAAWVVRR